MRLRLLALGILTLGFGAGLFLAGRAIDAAPYSQYALWRAIRIASLGGVALGGAASLAFWLETPGQRLLLLPLALFVWRLAYFPLMVFSGHVASIGEWLLASLGLPIRIYGVFLVAIAALHAAACFVSALLLRPVHPTVRLVVPACLAVAAAVSFSKWEDLRVSPDRVVALDAPVPPPVGPGRNPYLAQLFATGYAPHQRVMLLAAGLTWETIPPSPWARTVKSVLEVLFDQNPHGSTADRIREHYLAYASAHPLIGCRSFASCPVAVAPPPTPPDGR